MVEFAFCASAFVSDSGVPPPADTHEARAGVVRRKHDRVARTPARPSCWTRNGADGHSRHRSSRPSSRHPVEEAHPVAVWRNERRPGTAETLHRRCVRGRSRARTNSSESRLSSERTCTIREPSGEIAASESAGLPPRMRRRRRRGGETRDRRSARSPRSRRRRQTLCRSTRPLSPWLRPGAIWMAL